MRKLSNKFNIDMAVAIWLASDSYDYVSEPNYISATTLLKPTRMIVLGERNKENADVVDIVDRLASRSGTAIHDAIENIWNGNFAQGMRNLGITEEQIARIRVNPTEVDEAYFNIFCEQRFYKEFEGFKIGGKIDVCINGQLNDYKNVGGWGFLLGDKSDDYIMQGSIYRWLNPQLITKNTLKIHNIIRDHASVSLVTDKLPESPIVTSLYKLLDYDVVTHMVREKLKEITEQRLLPTEELMLCPEEELWMTTPKFKYFSKATNKKATKNFDNLSDAQAMVNVKGGVIKSEPSVPKRCNYCEASNSCAQRKMYFTLEEF